MNERAKEMSEWIILGMMLAGILGVIEWSCQYAPRPTEVSGFKWITGQGGRD